MFFIRLLLLAFIILGIAQAVPGIYVSSFWAAVLFAFILGVLNKTIRPVLLILTLPISVLTVGIFALLINALTFWLGGSLCMGVEVTSFSAAFWGGALVWLASFFLRKLQGCQIETL